jgi:23S rRNA (adenine2503-C2)-methyltransferase
MPTAPVHFFDLDPAGLQQLVESLSMPRFRAAQLFRWVYERGVVDPALMTDFSIPDRQRIAERLVFTTLSVAQHQMASDGTQKLLLEIADRGLRIADLKKENGSPTAASGAFPILSSNPQSAIRNPQFTECVMIPAENEQGKSRRTACISSQVGCPVGCKFCASGLGGLDQNLTAGQVLEQVWHLNQLPALKQLDQRITNIVFMGMGEPLSNYENVTRAIRTLTAEWGFHISARRITVSTVGLPAQIRRLADAELPPVTLAISLHAPNDELRRTLIPWANYTTIEAILDAADYYFQKTGREVTLEYILLDHVNDRPEHAVELADIARRLRCNVNLIRYNEVKGLPFGRPSGDAVHHFQSSLQGRGVNAHIRASRGRDIAAACGQLRYERNTRSSAGV